VVEINTLDEKCKRTTESDYNNNMARKNKSFHEALGDRLSEIVNNANLVLVIIISAAVSSVTSFVLTKYGEEHWSKITEHLTGHLLANALVLSAVGLIGIVFLLVFGLLGLTILSSLAGKVGSSWKWIKKTMKVNKSKWKTVLNKL